MAGACGASAATGRPGYRCAVPARPPRSAYIRGTFQRPALIRAATSGRSAPVLQPRPRPTASGGRFEPTTFGFVDPTSFPAVPPAGRHRNTGHRGRCGARTGQPCTTPPAKAQKCAGTSSPVRRTLLYHTDHMLNGERVPEAQRTPEHVSPMLREWWCMLEDVTRTMTAPDGLYHSSEPRPTVQVPPGHVRLRLVVA
jgi:hypothetical protein